jgi:protein TonB
MADPKNIEHTNIGAGHLAVHVSGVHAPDLTFSFERPKSGVGVGGSVAAHLLLAAIAVFIATYSTTPAVSLPRAREALPADIVWLDVPGPGGGGGGGGNQMPDPPKKAEVPGKEAVSVPAQPPEAPRPEPPKPEVEQQPLEIPAKTMGDVAAIVPGSLDTALDASLSQGIGVGGGAGTGQGTGIGSGRGSGLGEGFGKGTGGGYYRPGNGVELPRPIREVRPQYTADAMRAKVQGTVWVECIVTADGNCSDARVTKSLDSVFGLDQEAVKAARQWRFVPGTRMGQPVNVLVTIELTFTLR